MISNSRNRFFMAFVALAFFFIFACSSDDGESGAMDGTWCMDEFTLIISGKNYTLKYDGENETKGTVIYDDSTFEFTITHDWDWDKEKWVPTSASVKKVSGKYVRNGGVSVFSEVSQSMFNGEWIKK